MSPTRELIRGERGLKAQVCFCGAKKASMQTVCPTCYWCLARQTRTALYRRVGEGYAEAVAAALEELRAAGRIA